MRYILFFAMVISCMTARAQTKNYQGLPSLVWPKLYDVTFINVQDGKGEYQQPVFSEAVKKLNGKLVTLPGYIVPFENGMKSKHLMLSAQPLNACFFCGVGGPETAIEVFLKEEMNYTEKPVEFQGILRINDADPDKMIYTLERAEFLGEVGL
jgi:hypothetical protein